MENLNNYTHCRAGGSLKVKSTRFIFSPTLTIGIVLSKTRIISLYIT